jgi:hypothetical protein
MITLTSWSSVTPASLAIALSVEHVPCGTRKLILELLPALCLLARFTHTPRWIYEQREYLVLSDRF